MSIDVGQAGGIPNGALWLANNSGNLAATAGAATLTSVAGRIVYLLGFIVMGLGATGTSTISITVTGLVNGTWTLPYVVIAGVGLQNPTLAFNFSPPLQGNPANNIAVNLPSFGTGNTNATVIAWGYLL